MGIRKFPEKRNRIKFAPKNTSQLFLLVKMMKIVSVIKKRNEKISESIKKYACLPQHHLEFFLNYHRKNEAPIFFDLGGSRGLLAYRSDKDWRFLTDPIADSPDKLKVFLAALEYVFSKTDAKKIILEDITVGFYKEIISAVKNRNWRSVRPAYSLFWPIIDLVNFEPSLAGGSWKRLRNIKNKFFRENKVDFKTPSEFSKDDLKKIAISWKSRRNDTDRVHFEPYLRFIENGFKGFDLVRIMVLNDCPVAINGGWKIPNSRNYYSCLGLYDYSCDGIGEVSYLDEMTEIKKLGYEKIDLGGSSGGLLDFKKKFHPDSIYKTDTFSILKK